MKAQSIAIFRVPRYRKMSHYKHWRAIKVPILKLLCRTFMFLSMQTMNLKGTSPKKKVPLFFHWRKIKHALSAQYSHHPSLICGCVPPVAIALKVEEYCTAYGVFLAIECYSGSWIFDHWPACVYMEDSFHSCEQELMIYGLLWGGSPWNSHPLRRDC